MSGRAESKIVKGGANVFADLDLPDADDLLGKARLAAAIAALIEDRGLTQGEAARLLGASQPTVSNLVRGRLSGFSLDRLLRFFALPTPEAYGYFHPGRGRTTDGNPLRTSRDLARLLEERRISRFVMKPSEGMEGRGFVAAERMSDGRIRRIDAEDSESVEAFVEARLSLPGGYLMQAYVVQHPELAEVNPTSLNTVRMFTFQPRGEGPRCLGGFLRIGRTGSLVDNLHQGGLFSVVDLETGTLGMARRSIPSSQLLEHHPDSGARIAGRVLPFWPEARALCEAALEAFPYIRFAGLDIGFSAEGPLVIEMNVEPGYRGFARIRCPSVRALSDRGRD